MNILALTHGFIHTYISQYEYRMFFLQRGILAVLFGSLIFKCLPLWVAIDVTDWHYGLVQDGTEKWQRWEELVHLLWMLLFSYNKTMKGEIPTHCSLICRCYHEKGLESNILFLVVKMIVRAYYKIYCIFLFHKYVLWNKKNFNNLTHSVCSIAKLLQYGGI